MGDLLSILKFLFVDNAYYLLGILALVIILRIFLYWDLISGNYEKHQALFHDAETMVRERTWGNRYLWFLERLLYRVATWVGDRDVFFRQGRKKELPTPVTLKNTLTPVSYDFCLKIAVVYPIFSLFIAWVISGDGELGSLAAFIPKFSLIERVLSLGALIASMLSLFWTHQQSGWKQWAGALIAGAFTLSVAGTDTFAAAFTFTFAFVFGAAAAVIFAFTFSGVFTFVFAFSATIAVSIAVAFTGVVTDTGVIAIVIAAIWI